MSARDLVEDSYFVLLALGEKISQKEGEKAYERLRGKKRTKEEYENAIRRAIQILEEDIPPEEWME